MRTVRLEHAVVLAAVFGAIATTPLSTTQGASAGSQGVGWDRDPTALLVSYRDIWAELANPDPIPLIRIYGDGRVLAHYPDYTPKAGEYELRLQPSELENLLLSLLAEGLATFDADAVTRFKVSEERRTWEAAVAAARPPEIFMVADDSTSVFELHLTSYRPAGAEQTSEEVHRTISWLGLGTDAGRYPTIEPIQQLRAAELELRALLERPDLRRIGR